VTSGADRFDPQRMQGGNKLIGTARVTRLGLAAVLIGSSICVAAVWARAQPAPSQPIKIVVGVPAGGLGDLAARILAQRLSEKGNPAIVENRLGGNGIVATDAVAKARPDGYTLIMGNHSTLAILPHLTRVGYDPEKDLSPIALMLMVPNVAIVKAALPVTSMQELVRYGKANRLTNATQGIGASGHLIGEQFKQLAGVDLVHVHYRGAASALQDVVAGHVDMMFDVVALTREHALSGEVRALAVLSPQRNPVLPNLPTSAEAGFAALEGGAWFGLMAPAGTPRGLVDWFNAESRKAFESPEVVERLSKQGLQLPLGTPEEFAALIAAESRRWADVIRKGGIKIESN
jgi:tripartite-type tricarboxylate transporter receptor subunit TctC